MTRRVLIILIICLLIVLSGLIALLIHFSKNSTTNSNLLQFVTPEMVAIVKVDKPSKTLKGLFSNEIFMDWTALNDLKYTWNLIDSVSSRNYKTADILSSASSLICLDSMGNYLLLCDLQKKANEHFIDQFLSHNSFSGKIYRLNNGTKLFQLNDHDTLYYCIKYNVLGFSPSNDFIIKSMMNNSPLLDSNVLYWQLHSKSQVSVFVRNPAFFHYGNLNLLTNIPGPGEFCSWYWFDVTHNSKSVFISGELKNDTTNSNWQKWYNQDLKSTVYFDPVDTSITGSGYFQFIIADSNSVSQPGAFHYFEFADSNGTLLKMMISDSKLLTYKYQKLRQDTSTQIIPMSNQNIQEVLAVSTHNAEDIMPYNPFPKDSTKLLISMIHRYAVISSAMEAIIHFEGNFPFKSAKQRRSKSRNWMYIRQLISVPHKYWLTVEYKTLTNTYMKFNYTLTSNWGS